MKTKYQITYEAKQAYREGLSQHDNPYPKGTWERLQWSHAMSECEHEELFQLLGGFA